MDEPELLPLDEPTSGLDLPSRERLIGSLDTMAAANPGLPTVTVTHHLEEIPASSTHALLLAAGRIVAAGPVEEALTAATVSTAFGLEVALSRHHGRWAATVARAPGRATAIDRGWGEPLISWVCRLGRHVQ
jgi:iron complex transport system ATP-binding protein